MTYDASVLPAGRSESRASAGNRLRLEGVDDFAALRDEWGRLAEAGDSVFSTWEWAESWWRHFGAGRRLALTACRDARGETVAILPLYLWRTRPLRVVRLVGHAMGNQLGPVCAPADRAEAAVALREALRELRCDLFLGEKLPPADAWADRLGGRVLRRDPSPRLRLDVASWEDYLARCSANFRQQLGRKERKLEREHDVRFRLAADPERLPEDLDTLFALHTRRWEEGSSTFLTGARREFQREFALRAFERGWLRLWFLEADGRPVAVWCGFRFGGVDSYYQAGRDLDWDSHSVGLLLVAHSIRESIADGIGEYRLGPGGMGYKYRFTDDDPGLELVALAGSMRGRLGLTAAVAARHSGPAKPLLSRALSL
jgi:CelD/BcsL family acetyltransferase involved in cellulose biosynthesis